MTTVISALTATSIKHCMLIDITVNATNYYISNAYGPLTYNGNTYTQLGNFLNMSEIQDDLKIFQDALPLDFFLPLLCKEKSIASLIS